MKFIVSMLITLAFACSAIAQYNWWSTPTLITTGPDTDIHPTIANGFQWMWSPGNAELLAFSRNGKNIGVIRTYARDTTWSSDIYFVANDSADNDFPSAFHTVGSQSVQERAMLVWQARRNGNLEIIFSKYENLVWSNPQPVANSAEDDRFPHINQLDSSYFVVWEQRGKILFAEYSTNSWSSPQVVSQPDDTLNHLPQVSSYYASGSNHPFVMWERRKDADTTYAVMYAQRVGAAWSAPDTLVFAGNNRRPRIFKYANPSSMFWEQHAGNNVQSNSGYISVSGGKLKVQNRSSLTYLSQFQKNAAVNGFAVITNGSPMQQWFSVAAWETRNGDSIGVSVGPFGGPNAKVSAGGSSMNNNLDVSQGNFITSGHVRLWVVWEATISGRTKLYGSYTILSIGDVEEGGTKPPDFFLKQNYPNPFNPTTRIEYAIPRTSHVSLKVFDVMGREVASLVDEVQDSGFKSVHFDAGGLASGVYLYRLQSGGFTATRKLLLLR